MQFAEQLLGRGALSLNTLDEFSLDVGLQAKPGSELPQGIPCLGTQAEVRLFLGDCLIELVEWCLLFILLKTSSPFLKTSESWFPSQWASTEAKPS